MLLKILKIDEKGRLFMNIWDKVNTTDILQDNKKRCCPPHSWPHSLPFVQPKVEDEPCHVHKTNWRQYSHHNPFCQMLKCPHYQDMLKAREKYLEDK